MELLLSLIKPIFSRNMSYLQNSTIFFFKHYPKFIQTIETQDDEEKRNLFEINLKVLQSILIIILFLN